MAGPNQPTPKPASGAPKSQPAAPGGDGGAATVIPPSVGQPTAKGAVPTPPPRPVVQPKPPTMATPTNAPSPSSPPKGAAPGSPAVTPAAGSPAKTPPASGPAVPADPKQAVAQALNIAITIVEARDVAAERAADDLAQSGRLDLAS